MQFMCYILIALTAAAQVPAGNTADEDNLQGDWIMISKDARLTGGRTLRFNGDKFEIIKSDGQVEGKGTFKRDAKTMPREIDLFIDKGDRKVTVLGIYDLKGDKLKLCGNRGKGARPTRFPQIETEPSVTLLERKKEEKK